MKTLELSQIAGYLPYGLCVETETAGKKQVFRVTTLWASGIVELAPLSIVGYNQGKLSTVKPILRPLSDLYRTVTHNGEEIEPIVECAKKLFQNTKWKVHEKVKSNEFSPYVEIERVQDNLSLLFCYDFGQFRLFMSEKKAEIRCDQIQLFDFLHELKIDYRNLIDAGLAIDANTLENNPYE
jgi:hypothetical protein